MTSSVVAQRWLVGLTASLLTIWFAGASEAKTVNVVLLAGQSNASGRASISELPSSPLDAGIEFYYDTDVTGASTRLDSGGNFLPLAPPSSTFGPEFGLGRTLSGKGIDDLAIVKVTRGGTNLRTDWEKGNTNGDEMYSLFVSTVSEAFDVIQNRGDTVNVLGMAWHQGEGDNGYESNNPGAYQSNLTQFISDVRTDLNLPNMPFFIGEVFPVGREDIIAAQQATAASVTGSQVIHSTQFEVFDVTTHLDGKSQLWLGTRFANALSPSWQHVEFEPSLYDVGPLNGQAGWVSTGTTENLIVSTVTSGSYVAGQAAGHVDSGGSEQFGNLGLVPVYGRSMTADFFAGDSTDHDQDGNADYDDDATSDSTVRLYGWSEDTNDNGQFSVSNDERSVGFGLDSDGVFKLRDATGAEIDSGVNYAVDTWYRLSLTWSNPDELGNREVSLFANDLTNQTTMNAGDPILTLELSAAQFGSDPSTWIGTGLRATRGLIDNIRFAANASTADFDLDGDIDSDDLLRWTGDFGQNGYSDADGDRDSDGSDFLAWQTDHSLASPPSVSVSIPEPTGFTLFFFSFICFLSLRIHR
ncbi:sialate O-acetylesterase [Adhaeretor mobilis]|uniref:sialate O-acetylesterase n=1 Tax=Adhaeretor mobilis TaxID=1930276 RepID=UPI001C54E826|nr:sialate O-acetylesterase [Adhaeretor mobilis]